MKNIELTEAHKSKLSEMCKILFPEYTFEFIRGEDDLGYMIWDYFTFYLTKDYENCKIEISKTDIHWFEFCWKLLNKILSNQKEINPVYIQECVLNFGMICFNNSPFQHPIDYLYEKFKIYEKK